MKSGPRPLSSEVEAKILRRIPQEIVAVAALMAVAIGLVFDFPSGLLCLSGGLISALSFFWLRRSLERHLEARRGHRLRSLLGWQFLRLGLIGLIFLIIIYFFSRRALAFIAGFAAIIIVILGEAVFILSRAKAWKA